MEYNNRIEWERKDPDGKDPDPYMIFNGEKISLRAMITDENGNPIKRAKTAEGFNVATEEKKPLFKWANDVKTEPVEYVWFPYFIANNTNVFGGEAGTGKTWNLAAIVAAVTTKQPDGMPGIVEKHGNVLYLGGEDGNSVMRQRLEDLGADLAKIALVENSLDCTGSEFIDLIESVKPVLIIFDPLLSYWPPGKNPNQYTDIRQVMDYLREIARDKKMSIVCVIHPPKKDDNRLIHRFTGSGGFVDSVRAVTYVGYHPTDPYARVGIQPKNNAINTVPYAFKIDPELGFVWQGEAEDVTIKDVQNALRLEMGKSGNLQHYIKVLESVMKINPQGLHMTAKEILDQYSKVISHDIEPKSFGIALNNKALAGKLLKEGIKIEKGSSTGNRQKYHMYYAYITPLDKYPCEK